MKVVNIGYKIIQGKFKLVLKIDWVKLLRIDRAD